MSVSLAPCACPASAGGPASLTTLSPRCISCSSNRWTCQWDLRYRECREASPNPEAGIVPAHMVRRCEHLAGAGWPSHSQAAPDQPCSLQEDSCPQFLNPSPLVIPMNHETDVTFQGKNLDTVKVEGGLWGAGLGALRGPWGLVECLWGFFRALFLQNQSQSAWSAFEPPLAQDPASEGGALHMFGDRRRRRGPVGWGYIPVGLGNIGRSRRQRGLSFRC